MSVCKIIPIKQSKGVSNCLDYISDEQKVISDQKKIGDESLEERASPIEDNPKEAEAALDFHTVLHYMQNDKKTHSADDVQKKYISGFMCAPENAVQEFLDTKKRNLSQQGKDLSQETGNWAYHIIQSFPEGLDISDDEVHQCGRELCEKLGFYQAVICSHVHPVTNDKNEISGKCKHNHILINSHMHPDKLDPEKPGVFKYNNCRETYAQLQKWNDEISLDHGLPIIRNPDLDRKYSWFKTKMENEDASWAQQVAKDIKNTMRFCSNWEQFKAQMSEQGYHIRDTGKTITYYTPEHTETHKQQIREKKLGREYTRAEMERYWATIGKAKEKAQRKGREPQVRLIADLVRQYDTALFAEVVTKSEKRIYTLDVPMKNPRREMAEQSLRTYFEPDKTYNLCTFDHVPIAQVTGQDLFDYYEELRKEKEKRRKRNVLQDDQEEFFYDTAKLDSETKKPYRVRLWDESGRRRTAIELTCILAITIIKREHAPIDAPPVFKYKGPDGKFIYAKTDWKIQNMYNTVTMAREMKVTSSADVTKRLDRAGKEVARTRKQLRHLTEQHNQMQAISENLTVLESVRGICEEIYNMPAGEEKSAAEAAHAIDIAQYTKAKAFLHAKNINTEEQIAEFKERYTSTSAHLQEVQESFESANQEYRSLKKIEYNINLAQNNYYCYGPDHEMFANEKTTETPAQEQ